MTLFELDAVLRLTEIRKGFDVEYFIITNSFAAPFVSDQSTGFKEGVDARAALEAFALAYTHPAGLYAAQAYESADAYHKGAKPIAQWLCNQERAKQRLTSGLGAWSEEGHGPGTFVINGKAHEVKDPKSGYATLSR